MTNDIENFYLNIEHDNNPIYNQVLSWNYEDLEKCHTWCQRAFPNFEPSEVVPGSPVLNIDTLDFLKKNCELKIYKMVHHFMTHYSLLMDNSIHHNNLRVTRLLKFLSVLGYNELKVNCFNYFFYCLKRHHYDEYNKVIAINYWINALSYGREENETA